MVEAELQPLDPPFEFLEFGDGQSVKLALSAFEEGLVTIHPRMRDAPRERTVRVLRLHLKEGYKAWGMPYWDVNAGTLVFQLKALLPKLAETGQEFEVAAHGQAPKKRYSVRLVV